MYMLYFRSRYKQVALVHQGQMNKLMSHKFGNIAVLKDNPVLLDTWSLFLLVVNLQASGVNLKRVETERAETA